MPRLSTSADIFNAIAEPRRREIIALLHDGREWAVNDLVGRISIAQSGVSKHLGVLRKVGVVTVTKRGQQRMYRLHPEQLKPIHDWVKSYERYWTHSISRIKQAAEASALANAPQENSPRIAPKKPRRNSARIAHRTDRPRTRNRKDRNDRGTD